MTVRRAGSRTWTRVLRGEIPPARALKLSADLREELLWEASIRLEADELDDAEFLFQLCATLWRDKPDGSLGVGVCRMKKDQIADAVMSFRESQKVDQHNPFTLSNLAECFLLQGDRVAAQDSLDRIDESADPRKNHLTDRLAHLRKLVSAGEPPIA
jgi:Flp pilus assembly protein TadD